MLRQKKAVMDKDEQGNNIVTEKYLKDLCEENGQYLTPHLNDTLYLHYKGKAFIMKYAIKMTKQYLNF